MVRLYFATDLHGSEKAWQKFLRAGKFYKANVVVLGGDMTGKAIVPIIKKPDGTYLSMFMEREWVLRTPEELRKHEEQILTNGLYIYHTDNKGYEELVADEEKKEKLFLELTIQRVRKWMMMADEELKGSNVKYYVCPGNDDRFEIDPVIEESKYVENAEGKVIRINNKYEMISTGWTNPTPWDTPRECTEEELGKKIENLISKVENNATAIYAFHAPPYDSGLDYAPKIDEKKLALKSAGQELVPVGSTSIYKAIKNYQPLLGLHGHIHESKAICKIGRTYCVNPGSMYDTGILVGIIINLENGKVKSYLPVSG